MPSVESLTEQNILQAQKNGYKKVAIVATQQDSCLLQKKIFEESGKFQIVYSDEIISNDLNLKEVALKVVQSRPDAVFLSTMPPQGSTLAKFLRQLGYKADIFGGLQMANLAELKASDAALVGAWVVAGDDRHAHEYFERYYAKFKEYPTAESIYAYDSFKLIYEALQSGKVLNQYLHTVNNFQGLGGKYSSDEKNGFKLQVVSKKFVEGGFEYLD